MSEIYQGSLRIENEETTPKGSKTRSRVKSCLRGSFYYCCSESIGIDHQISQGQLKPRPMSRGRDPWVCEGGGQLVLTCRWAPATTSNSRALGWFVLVGGTCYNLTEAQNNKLTARHTHEQPRAGRTC